MLAAICHVARDAALLLIDASGNVRCCNRAAADLVGWSQEEIEKLCAKRFFTRVLQSEPPDFSAIKPDSVHELEVARIDSRSAYQWLRVAITPLNQAEPAGYVVSLADITTSRMEPDVAHGSSVILNHIGHAVIFMDAAGIVRIWNEGAERLFGWPSDAMLGQPYISRFPASIRDNIQTIIAQFQEGGEWDGEFEDYRRDGSRVWIHARVSRVLDSEGKLLGLLGISHDISEIKQLETRLRELQQQYQRMNDLSSEAMLLHGAEGVVLDANMAASRLLGYSYEELLGMMPLTIYPGLTDDFKMYLAENVIAGKSVEYEAVYQRRDGSAVPVSVRLVPFSYNQGNLLTVSLSRNIEREKQSEQRWRLLNQALASVTQAVVICEAESPQAPIVYVSPSFERVTGHSVESVLGKNYFDLLGDTSLPEIAQLLAAFQRGDAYSTVLESKRRDGSSFHMEVSFAPIHAADGKLAHYIAIQSDVTERVEMTRALRESEERFRQIASATDHVIWMTEVPSFKILYASPAFATVWGRSLEELYREDLLWLRSIHPDDRDRVESTLQGVLANPESRNWDYEYRIVHANGEIRWVHDRGNVIRDAAGNIFRLVGHAHDITEQKQLQEQLLQSQKMEAIGQLAGGIAHDFNNLLMVILGYSESLRGTFTADSAAGRQVREIYSAGERAATLTRQLLAFGRKQVLNPRKVQLNDLIGKSLLMMERLIGQNIQIVTRYDSRLDVVQVDPVLLEQVLVNLVVNARDAMPQGGTITIETRNLFAGSPHQEVAANTSEASHWVEVSVSDTGCGIPAHLCEKIFEPFFTTKEPGKGTGLGLSTAYGIVKQSGGDLTVQSQVGHGSIFRIRLPAIKSSALVTVERENFTGELGPLNVLLVEDDPHVRDMLRTFLSGKGCRLVEAESGAAAVQLAANISSDIELLLCDIELADVSGFNLAEMLLRSRPHMRILFMTGYGTRAPKQGSPSLQKAQVVHKPFKLEELMSKIRIALGPS